MENPDNGTPQKKVQPLVKSGEIVRRKKPLGKRFSDLFFKEDSKSVGKYVLLEVLIPGVRDMVFDVSKEALERKFYGNEAVGHRSSRGASYRHGGYTNYNQIGGGRWDKYRDDPRDRKRPSAREEESRPNFDELIIPTKAIADATIDQMFTLLSQFEVVSVADLYDILSLSSDFTERQWGWTDLRGARAVRVREGYLLDLPSPIPLSA